MAIGEATYIGADTEPESTNLVFKKKFLGRVLPPLCQDAVTAAEGWGENIDRIHRVSMSVDRLHLKCR